MTATKTRPQGVPAAFFDFDGTLIDGYSAMSVYKERARSRQIGPGEVARLSLLSVRSLLGQSEAEEIIRTAAQAFAGKRMEELERIGEKVTRTVLAGCLYPEAVELIAEHRRQGHLIVIASSALPFQIEAIARELEVDAVVCTQLEHDDGVCTGRIAGDVLWGAAKAAAVCEAATRLGIDLSLSHGYANGDEDIDFLETVAHPHAVNAGDRLTKTARERGWPSVRFTARARGSLMDYPRTIASYSGLVTSCVVAAGVGALNGSRRVTANTAMSVGGDLALSLAGVELNVVGEHHLWSHRPAVFITNHQSNLDALILFKLLRRDITTMAKKEIGQKPILAQFAWVLDLVLLDRADVSKAKEAMGPVVDRLATGCSVAVAPEGTRSLTNRVGPFKKGPFHIAMQAGVPIVPIVMRNTGELQWRGSRIMRAGEVDVAVLPPISVEGWDSAGMNDRIAEVRKIYVEAMADWSSVLERV